MYWVLRAAIVLSVLLLAGCVSRMVEPSGPTSRTPLEMSITAPATAVVPTETPMPAPAATTVPATPPALPAATNAASPAGSQSFTATPDGRTIPESASPAARLAVDWRPYRSEGGAFAMRYPASFTIYQNQVPGVDGILAPAPRTVALRQADAEGLVLSVAYQPVAPNTDASAFAGQDDTCPAKAKGEPFTLAGEKGVLFADTPCGPYGSSLLYATHGPLGYRVAVVSPGDYGSVRQWVVSILSTFEFLPPAPAPSPTGAADRLVFASRRTGNLEIYSMPVPPAGELAGPAQANPQQLTRSQNWSGSPAVSPDGRRVAYVVETRRADGSPHDREIYLVNSAGSSSPVNLSSHPALDYEPAWSPDGQQIAFVSNRAGEATSQAIYVLNVDEAAGGRGDSSARLIAENGGAPAWSPDGRQIAFISDRETPGLFQAYVMNADGSGVRRLTGGPRTGNAAGVGRPAWSPDGTHLALPGDWEGNREIYLLTVGGSGMPHPVNLSNNPGYDDFPAWSPDGKQLAFISTRAGAPGLYVMDSEGQTVRVLAPGLTVSAPAWSPDGTRLAFVASMPDGNQDIYMVNGDGSGLLAMTQDPAQDTFPTWAVMP